MLIISSPDSGLSWGEPRSVAESVRADGKVLAFFGMVNGVQLRCASHDNLAQIAQLGPEI